MIGLVGGLGIGAGIHYYRELATAHEARSLPLELTMVHADLAAVARFFADADRHGLARYLARILGQLKAAGATVAVIPAVTPHMCVAELMPISPLPLVNMIDVVAATLSARSLTRVALFGTRFVVESDLFGKLTGVDVVRPQPAEIGLVHDIYTRLARTGAGTADDHARLSTLATTICDRDGVEAILLAGTDLAVLFNESNTRFPHLDCASAHIQAIMRT
jgi:aspartate racemase